MIVIAAERGTEVFGRTMHAKELVFVGWADENEQDVVCRTGNV